MQVYVCLRDIFCDSIDWKRHCTLLNFKHSEHKWYTYSRLPLSEERTLFVPYLPNKARLHQNLNHYSLQLSLSLISIINFIVLDVLIDLPASTWNDKISFRQIFLGKFWLQFRSFRVQKLCSQVRTCVIHHFADQRRAQGWSWIIQTHLDKQQQTSKVRNK